MANDSGALSAAARGGHTECVALLPVSDPLAAKSLALRCAAQEGHAEYVRLLLPASDPLAVNEDGVDAVGSARKNGHLDVAGMIESFIESQALSESAQPSTWVARVKAAL